ncbi:hypothetical protein [Microbulbifer epialgicus]|uniref:Intracellular proteinase inhibitor n=1 Tax=Microbulbifer epialgicus TaxID=393907 RepID=A0ABV4P4Z1_9GAMM
MKKLISFLLIFLSNVCFAVGWEELSIESANERKINIVISYNEKRYCHRVEVSLPSKIIFENIGERELWSVHYRTITERDKGWQLFPKGAEIILPVKSLTKNGNNISMCLSELDLRFGYLSVNYGGLAGSPPMIVLIKISDFK